MQELKKKEMEELQSVLGQLGIDADAGEVAQATESAAAAKRRKKKEKKMAAAPDEMKNGKTEHEESAPEPQPEANGSSEAVRPHTFCHWTFLRI